MNKLDLDYQNLLKDILENGTKKETRNGGTISVFGRQIRHKMLEGFPLLTTKKMPFRLIATELMWFLRGDTNIKFLVDNNCNIWNGDAYKAYSKWNDEANRTSPFGPVPKLSEEDFIKAIKLDDDWANQWGELGPVYGKQWRDWTANPNHTWGVDQIAILINELKTNPDSRRLMVNAWNVGELDQMTLPPCHYGFQVYTRELSFNERLDIAGRNNGYEYPNRSNVTKEDNTFWDNWLIEQKVLTRAISLMWNQRSVDTFLGLPFNIASYGLLLEIIAKEVNMVPDELIGNLGDTHLYLDHIEQAKEQRTREPYPLPKLFFKYEKETYIDNYELDGFFLKDYQSHPTIKAPLSN